MAAVATTDERAEGHKQQYAQPEPEPLFDRVHHTSFYVRRTMIPHRGQGIIA